MRQLLRLCLDPRVLVAFGALGVATWLLAPGLLLSAVPLLLLLACPASMIVMAVLMRSSTGTTINQTAPRDAGRVRSELADLEVHRSTLEAELAAAETPDSSDRPAPAPAGQEIATR
jgi:UPF0716 family protein affecting phage T7 exclusion